MSKYHAKPTVVDGIRFDSKREAARYAELKLLEQAGEIQHLKAHPRYEIVEGYFIGEEWVRPVYYEGDFEYFDGDHFVTEDVKGVETAVFRLKKKLFQKRYPQELRIVK